MLRTFPVLIAMNRWHPRLVLCLIFALMLPACTTKNIMLQESNSLLVNKFGVMCNPRDPIAFDKRKITCKSQNGNPAYVSDKELPTLVQADLKDAARHAEKNDSDKIKLLIYIHGGLNKVTESLQNNVPLKSAIIGDDEHWYYPKFLVWPSDGLTNYSEHALNVSGGRYTENVLRGLFGGTATLISDSLQGIVNIPRSWYIQAVNAKDYLWGLNDKRYQDLLAAYPSPIRVSHAWVQARDNYCKAIDAIRAEADDSNCIASGYIKNSEPTIPFAEPRERRNRANINWSNYERDSLNPLVNPGIIWNRISALSRLSIGSLTHSEIGAASWRNMKRRAFNVTSPTVLFDSRIQNRHPCSRDGKRCVSGIQYFDELLSQINASPDPSRYELTLIGHSMGAFILNSLINTHLDQLVKHQILSNVVYMAAAATIEETILTIRNLYQAYDSRGVAFEQWPQVSNLMLNRVAEISEMMFFGLVPSGSLLVWVDEIYERPNHPAGRTIGAEVNVYSALPYITQQLGPYYTSKITFKSFDRTLGPGPSTHSEFNDGKFWHPTFWQLEPQ